MKVLLIKTPYLDVYGSMRLGANNYFPLGLGYIASVLRNEGHKVILFDPEVENLSYEEIKERIYSYSPDLVGIGCVTSNFNNSLRIARLVKRRLNIPLIIGGPHASALPEDILNNCKEFDVAVIGEGEYTMSEICKQKPLEQISGIAFRKNGNIIRTAPRKWIKDVDKLPLPARDLVNLNNYKPQANLDIGRRSATMITSRGCPFNCTYCASRLVLGKSFRPHSPEYVLNEIEYLIKTYHVEYIMFQDDTLTLDKKRMEKICSIILKKNLKFKWWCLTRVDAISEDLLNLMKSAGCFFVSYGIESGDDQILKNMKKGITVSQAKSALSTTNKVGLKSQCYYMFGNEGETKETMKKTISLSKELKSTLASFGLLIPFPGTSLFNKYCKDISYSQTHFEDYIAIGTNPLIEYEGVSKKDLQRFIYSAYLQFYARPVQLMRIIKKIRSFYEFLIYLKAAFGLLRQVMLWRSKSRVAGNA